MAVWTAPLWEERVCRRIEGGGLARLVAIVLDQLAADRPARWKEEKAEALASCSSTVTSLTSNSLERSTSLHGRPRLIKRPASGASALPNRPDDSPQSSLNGVASASFLLALHHSQDPHRRARATPGRGLEHEVGEHEEEQRGGTRGTQELSSSTRVPMMADFLAICS